MKIKTKRDQDNKTAYILRKQVEAFMSKYHDAGIKLTPNYTKDLDLYQPIKEKEESNTIQNRFVEGFLGHSFRLFHKDYPNKSIPIEVRVEMRGGGNHINQPHYVKMLSNNKTGDAFEDLKNYFYESVFIYFSSSGTIDDYKEFDYYAIEPIGELIDNCYPEIFYYAESKGNRNRICICPWTPRWIPISSKTPRQLRFNKLLNMSFSQRLYLLFE